MYYSERAIIFAVLLGFQLISLYDTIHRGGKNRISYILISFDK
jgi:hypothetical protein